MVALSSPSEKECFERLERVGREGAAGMRDEIETDLLSGLFADPSKIPAARKIVGPEAFSLTIRSFHGLRDTRPLYALPR